MTSVKSELENYNDILFNWERSPSDFLLWIEHVCGISGDNYIRIKKLFNDITKIKDWISNYFDGDIDNVLNTIELYKLNRAA